MNDENKRVPTSFGPELGFEIKPVAASQAGEFNWLSEHLLRERLALDPRSELPIKRAAKLATALARRTDYPLLVFPILFEERVALELAENDAADRLQPAAVFGVVLAVSILAFVFDAEKPTLTDEKASHSQARVVLAPAITNSPAPTPSSSFLRVE
jgi:hypothetical protein